MTDIARTLAQMQTLLADNTTHDISPQDVRDLMQSIIDPVEGGDFERHPGEHIFGTAEHGEEPLLFVGTGYGFKHGVSVRADYTGYTLYDGTVGLEELRSGHSTFVRYLQASLGVNQYAPLIYGQYVEAIANNEADGTSGGGLLYTFGAQIVAAAESEGGIFQLTGVLGDAVLAGETTASDGAVENAIGVIGTVDSETGFTGTVTSATSIRAEANIRDAITTTNYYGVRITNPVNGAGIVNGYGLHVADITKGSTSKWNVFSAGATSKNKFEGRMMQGAPNSAPTDADLGNGQISMYLDQAGNALKFRVKYSDGTLKTGSVALT